VVSRSRFISVAIASAVLLAARGAGTAARRRQHHPGFVTTQSGTIRLGGAQVVLHSSSNQEIATVLADGDGHYRFTAIQEGKYTLTASLEGFAVARAAVVVSADQTTERSLDLPLATLTQTVEVMAPTSIVSAADTLGSSESINSHETDEFANGSGLGGALRLLASVIEVPGGLSIKGGRPTQAGVQIGASTLTDPVLGLVHFTLPDDAIDSVAVMPNRARSRAVASPPAWW
jgi:hypothetical protein